MSLSGCSSSSDVGDKAGVAAQIRDLSTEARERELVTQADVLEDGVVTDAEYRQSYVDLGACLAASGLLVGELDPQRSLESYSLGYDYEFGSLSENAALGVADDCQAQHTDQVDAGWQLQHAGRIDPLVLVPLRECLNAATGAGLDDSANPSPEELRSGVDDATWNECVVAALRDAPELSF